MADKPSSSEDNLSPATVRQSSSDGSLSHDLSTPSEIVRTPFDTPSDGAKPPLKTVGPATGWPSLAPDPTETSLTTAYSSDRSSAFGGCSAGVLSLMPFLFVLAMVRKAGLPVDASSMVALVAGSVLLAIAVKSWPRRTMLWLGGYAAGLLAAYAVLWFLVKPLIVSGLSGAPSSNAQSSVPAPKDVSNQ